MFFQFSIKELGFAFLFIKPDCWVMFNFTLFYFYFYAIMMITVWFILWLLFWFSFVYRKKYLTCAGAVRKFGRNQVIVPHTRVARSISIKDVIAVLEREPQMSKSTLVYRLYEKIATGEWKYSTQNGSNFNFTNLAVVFFSIPFFFFFLLFCLLLYRQLLLIYVEIVIVLCEWRSWSMLSSFSFHHELLLISMIINSFHHELLLIYWQSIIISKLYRTYIIIWERMKNHSKFYWLLGFYLVLNQNWVAVKGN